MRSIQQQSTGNTEETAEDHPDDACDEITVVHKDSDSSDDHSSGAASTKQNDNNGKLIIDATCAPADIRFPVDISLLNEAREKTDEIIDRLQRPLRGIQPRPRTYRQLARRAFLNLIKRKKPGAKLIRKTLRKLLNFLRRNLRAIDALLQNPKALPLARLSRKMYKNLLVCRELYRQQLKMFESRTNRIDDRIVSISQPHVRPIKRGKARNQTEFGAKLSLSLVNGFSFQDRLSWDSYNESFDLIEQVESYRRRFGHYPESVHADQIYRTRKNRKYCKERGIRLSGPPLGRPPQTVSAADKKQYKNRFFKTRKPFRATKQDVYAAPRDQERREGDSNPRYLSVRRFSRPVHSATLPSLLNSTTPSSSQCVKMPPLTLQKETRSDYPPCEGPTISTWRSISDQSSFGK